MKTSAKLIFLCSIGSVLIGPGVALAADQAPARTTTTPPPVEEWYAGQIGLVYGGSVALLAGSKVFGGSLALADAGVLGILLGPPILHLAHENGSTAAAAFGLRALFIWIAAESFDACFNPFGGPSPDSRTCDLLGLAALADLIAIPSVDFAFARRTRRGADSSLSLLMLPPSRSRPGLLSIAAHF